MCLIFGFPKIQISTLPFLIFYIIGQNFILDHGEKIEISELRNLEDPALS